LPLLKPTNLKLLGIVAIKRNEIHRAAASGDGSGADAGSDAGSDDGSDAAAVSVSVSDFDVSEFYGRPCYT